MAHTLFKMGKEQQIQAKKNATAAMIKSMVNDERTGMLAKIRTLIQIDEALENSKEEFDSNVYRRVCRMIDKKNAGTYVDNAPSMIGKLYSDKNFLLVGVIQRTFRGSPLYDRMHNNSQVLKIVVVTTLKQDILDKYMGVGEFFQGLHYASSCIKTYEGHTRKTAKDNFLKLRTQLITENNQIHTLYKEIRDLKNNYDYQLLKLKMSTLDIIEDL